VKPRKTIPEQKTDTTHENRDEKTSIMNVQDISQKQEISNDVLDIDYMKEEKTRQSLISNHRTTTEENKHITKNKMVCTTGLLPA
jgi:hypothetical protein